MGIDETQRSLAHLVRRLACDSSVMIIDRNPNAIICMNVREWVEVAVSKNDGLSLLQLSRD